MTTRIQKSEISELNISEIKGLVAELLGFENTPSAQDIRELAPKFLGLQEILKDHSNFSKKDTWIAIWAWAQDSTDIEFSEENAEPSEENAEHSEEIFPIEDVAECSEEIEVVDIDCHFEIIPYVPMTQEIAERSEEKTAIYYAVCCLAVFVILTVQLFIDVVVWIMTWLVPTLVKFINSTVEKTQDVYRLYKQVKGINYLFIQ
jgi:hypothetical protein